jgi:hypothetical protein
MTQENSKFNRRIALLTVIIAIFGVIPAYLVFFDPKKENQTPVIIDDHSSKSTTVILPVNNKDDSNSVTKSKGSSFQKITRDTNILTGFIVDNTRTVDKQLPPSTNTTPLIQKDIDINGYWSFQIRADYFINSSGSKQMGRPKIHGTINIKRTGNEIHGNFSSDNWIQFKTAILDGFIREDSVFFEVKNIEGYCENDATVLIKAKIYDEKTFVGKCIPKGEPSGKCALYVGPVLFNRAF